MFFRFIRESLRRAPRRKALIVVAIALGSMVATAMLGVMLSIGDKINRELRQAGANIVVTQRAASVQGGFGQITASAAGTSGYINETDVPKIKSIFWTLNITGFAPSLVGKDGAYDLQGVWFSHPYKDPDGKTQNTGIREVNPTWKVVDGQWATDNSGESSECMIGSGVARRAGWKSGSDIQVLGSTFHVAGVISSGDEADDRILLPLARLQQLTNRPGAVDRIDVAALTKPEDAFARKDPRMMSTEEREKWECTNYVTVIAHQIQDAIPGTQARAIRRVADSEGKILGKVGGLMTLITLAAMLSAGLTVWSLTATNMMERRGEIAIMQAIGAARWLVGSILGIEIGLIGFVGGIIGSLGGVWLARFVAQSVFHDSIEVSFLLPFLIVAAATLVALAGAAQPLRKALRLEPAVILREGV